MFFSRLLPAFLSVLFAIGLWIYGAVRLQTDEVRYDGYATLVCGDGYSDSELRERLDSRGLTGLVSESDQWFLLDCFGSIEKVPLADYEERLLPFDPRNDGYAEKLKRLFVRDGKRFIYIPLGKNDPENIDARIAQALTGVSYSLEYTQPPPKRDILLPLTAFCLTACAFFAIPQLRRRLNASLLPCLCALSPLALGLAPGFALFSLLAGFAALLSELLGRKPAAGRRGALLHAPPALSAAQWLPALALIACYIFFSFFWGLPVHFAFCILASFCCTLAVSLLSGGGKLSIKFNINKSYRSRRRFTPVEIISRTTVSYGFFPVMLPFAVMALALAFTGFAGPQPTSSRAADISPLPAGAITEADFQEHYLFQTSFSFRALGKTYDDGELPLIAGYGLSSDGLLVPGMGITALTDDSEVPFPDFPLGDLLRGIRPDDSPFAADAEKRGNSSAVDWMFASLPMIFILPSFLLMVRRDRRPGARRGRGLIGIGGRESGIRGS